MPHDRNLTLLKPIFQNLRFIGIIIVPNPLRSKIFIHYHAGPTGGHMGEYKTLFRIRLRFSRLVYEILSKNGLKDVLTL